MTNMGLFPLQFLIDRYSGLPPKMEETSAKVFILAFFGFVLFPSSKTAFDPIIACIAEQACLRWDYSNMLLAETIMSLNKSRDRKKHIVLRASSGLLSMWFFSHLRAYKKRMTLYNIDSATHPLKRFSQFSHLIPKQSFYDWTNFMGQLTPEQLLWHAPWPRFHEVMFTSTEGNMVPLLGFNGGTAYCTQRVVRQFGQVQEMPPPWSSEPFAFDLPHRVMTKGEKRIFQSKVNKIVKALKRSPPLTVDWPEELEGEMELYYASLEYIEHVKRRQLEDREPHHRDLPPVVPVEEPPPTEPMDEPYVPEYVYPAALIDEPYIPGEISPPRDYEEDEDWELHEDAEVPQMTKKPRLG